MRRGLIITLVVVILLVILNGALYWYFKASIHDNRVMADITQIRSALELAYSVNTEYPIVTSPIKLADRDSGTEQLCKEGFKTFSTKCANVLLGSVPTFYKSSGEQYFYHTNTDGSDYKLEFSLLLNHKKLGIFKGTNCAATGQIVSGSCPLK